MLYDRWKASRHLKAPRQNGKILYQNIWQGARNYCTLGTVGYNESVDYIITPKKEVEWTVMYCTERTCDVWQFHLSEVLIALVFIARALTAIIHFHWNGKTPLWRARFSKQVATVQVCGTAPPAEFGNNRNGDLHYKSTTTACCFGATICAVKSKSQKCCLSKRCSC